MLENITLVAVLLLALYGIACLLHRLILAVLRPVGHIASFTLAFLRADTENPEQIIRYFRAKADKSDVLMLVDNGMTEEQKRIVETLCKNRQDVRLLSDENFVAENCNYQ